MSIAGTLPRVAGRKRRTTVTWLVLVSWLAIPMFLLVWEIVAKTGVFNAGLFRRR